MHFTVGQTVLWKYKTGWGGGRIAYADAEIVRVNRVKVKICVKRNVNGKLISEMKNVLPSSLVIDNKEE